jgi:hypothetical protein
VQLAVLRICWLDSQSSKHSHRALLGAAPSSAFFQSLSRSGTQRPIFLSYFFFVRNAPMFFRWRMIQSPFGRNKRLFEFLCKQFVLPSIFMKQDKEHNLGKRSFSDVFFFLFGFS